MYTFQSFKLNSNLVSDLGNMPSLRPETMRLSREELEKQPNIIIIVHESLSGVLQSSNTGRTNMPFFFGELIEDPNFYFFEHGRPISADTLTAIPVRKYFNNCLVFPFPRILLETISAFENLGNINWSHAIRVRIWTSD